MHPQSEAITELYDIYLYVDPKKWKGAESLLEEPTSDDILIKIFTPTLFFTESILKQQQQLCQHRGSATSLRTHQFVPPSIVLSPSIVLFAIAILK